MSTIVENTKVSRATYLEYDDALQGKSEFCDGEVFDMAGGTEAHSLISANMIGTLYALLKDTGCRAYTSDLKIEIKAANSLVYPDVAVVCGPQLLPCLARTSS